MTTRKTTPIPILISGFVGCGKSTLAKTLAKKQHAIYLSGSNIHRKILEERMKGALKNTKKIEEGFWETDAGKKGTALRAQDLSIDKKVDARMKKEITAHPHCVSDSRLAPWLYRGKAIRIWLNASEAERVKRVAQRDHLPLKTVKKAIRKRNNVDKRIYWKLYGIDMGRDFSPFDLILDNTTLAPNQTYRIVSEFIKKRMATRSGKKSN